MPRSTGSKRSRSQDVYARMRADIFAGRLAPGQRLKFPEMCAHYDTSVGVARETVTRLVLERLVTAQPNQGGQGYAVAELSLEDLAELTIARAEVETAAVRLSVEHGTPEWEGALVSAHHMLARLEVPTPQSSDDEVAAWSEAHERFHRTLLDGCPSRRLLTICVGLREEAELYRRWTVVGMHAARDVAAEHRALADAALDRDADRVARLLHEHIHATSRQLIADPDAVISGGADDDGDPMTADTPA